MAKSRNSTLPKFSWKIWAIVALLIAIPYIFLLLDEEVYPFSNPEPSNPLRVAAVVALAFASGGIASFFYYGLFHLVRRWIVGLVQRNAERATVERDAELLQDNLEADFVTNLVKINFKYLDKYYLQTQVQAEKSFVLSAISAAIGFSIILAGIGLMFRSQTNPAYVTVGAGVLSEFIAAVFFYLYNRTIIKMSDYHQKLVITQNISLALKISESLPDGPRVQAQLAIIQSLTDRVNMFLSNPASIEESATQLSGPTQTLTRGTGWASAPTQSAKKSSLDSIKPENGQ
ncbi:MAG: hypothetical protein N838_25705 [Thiohalocapsa sp. PB-PSB1]|nr:MAG: hypothetical protein N838_25705 [Thiohalocapsa sp. PB-PSB1]